MDELFSEAPTRKIRPHPEPHIERGLDFVETEPLSGGDLRVLAEAEVSCQISAFGIDGVVGEARLQERIHGGGIPIVDRIRFFVAPARVGPCVARRDRLQGEAQRRLLGSLGRQRVGDGDDRRGLERRGDANEQLAYLDIQPTGDAL